MAERNEEKTPFQQACVAIESGGADEFRHRLDQHPELVRDHGDHLMEVAAGSNRPEILAILADRGVGLAPVDSSSSPLGKAAESGAIEAAAWLLERGVGIESTTDRHGSSALHEAVTAGEIDMVKFLLDRGANPDRLHGNPKRNALACAILFRQEEVADYLRKRGVREIVVHPEPIDVESPEFLAGDGRDTMSWYEGKWHHVYDAAIRQGLDSLGEKNRAFFLVGYLVQQLANGGADWLFINPSGALHASYGRGPRSDRRHRGCGDAPRDPRPLSRRPADVGRHFEPAG